MTKSQHRISTATKVAFRRAREAHQTAEALLHLVKDEFLHPGSPGAQRVVDASWLNVNLAADVLITIGDHHLKDVPK